VIVTQIVVPFCVAPPCGSGAWACAHAMQAAIAHAAVASLETEPTNIANIRDMRHSQQQDRLISANAGPH
jgi:hypothetical protein